MLFHALVKCKGGGTKTPQPDILILVLDMCQPAFWPLQLTICPGNTFFGCFSMVKRRESDLDGLVDVEARIIVPANTCDLS